MSVSNRFWFYIREKPGPVSHTSCVLEVQMHFGSNVCCYYRNYFILKTNQSWIEK